MDGLPNLFVPLALAAFLPFVVLCFAFLPARRAVLTTLLAGWMFLPVFDRSHLQIPLVHTKALFVPFVVLVASLVSDAPRWRRLRLRRLDAPVVVLCLTPAAASIANGFGLYDAGSAVFEAAMVWGAPYALGRVYLADRGALRDVASAVVVAALVYAPLCLFEVRMSPQLHRMLYGYHQHAFLQHLRAGGFRPMVFMHHGLMVAMFMATGTLVAYWLWRTGARTTFALAPAGLAVALLAVTTVACKSAGALVLLATGLVGLEATHRLRTALPFLLLLACAPLYCTARLSGWSGGPMVEMASEAINAERAHSLAFRLRNEDLLVRRALQRPLFGWGRWGGSRVLDEHGRDQAPTDGLWIIMLGVSGFVGLVALGLTLLTPCVLLARRVHPRLWKRRRIALPAALAFALGLWTIDQLFNAMTTPLFPFVAGTLATVASFPRRRRARAVAARSRRPAPAALAPARIAW